MTGSGCLDVRLDNLAAGPGGRLYGVGSQGDTLCCLVALDTDPVRIAWVVALDDEENGASVDLRGEVLYVHGNADRDHMMCFDAATGERRGRIAAPGGVHAAAPCLDDSVLVVTHPRMKLTRIGADGRPSPLWPRRGFLGRLFPGGGASGVAIEPIPRPGYLPPPGCMAMGHDGDLRLAAADAVGRLDREGHLIWKTALPGATTPLAPPRAAPDGTTWALFVREGEPTLYRIEADGNDPAPLLSGLLTDLAVDADGGVWVLGPNEVRRLDRDGAVVWGWRDGRAPDPG